MIEKRGGIRTIRSMEIVDANGLKLYKWNIGPSSFLMNPSDGARLMNWYVSMADGAVRDVIFWPENAPLGGEGFAEVRGGMPVLFPFCGASFAGGKKDFWKTPEGEVLPMKKHGFAMEGKFDDIHVSDFDFHAKYVSSEESKASYPYDYNFSVYYRFNELSLFCELRLENLGKERIPWGAGLHPYFTLPWIDGTSRRDYRFLSDAKKACYIGADGSFMPAGTDKSSFSDLELNNRIHTSLKTSAVRFGPKNGEEDVTLKIGGGGKPEVGTCVVTWSESPDAPYYCVEPWMSPPNSASKPLHYVAPSETKAFFIEISLM